MVEYGAAWAHEKATLAFRHPHPPYPDSLITHATQSISLIFSIYLSLCVALTPITAVIFNLLLKRDGHMSDTNVYRTKIMLRKSHHSFSMDTRSSGSGGALPLQNFSQISSWR